MDLSKTAQLQQTIFQINLLVSSITHTKLSNEERGLLNAAAKRLEREFVNEVLGTKTLGSTVGVDGDVPVVNVADASPSPVRKLTKK
jgi:hypothetical protein